MSFWASSYRPTAESREPRADASEPRRRAGHDAERITGDEKLLVGRDHPCGEPRVVGRAHALAAAGERVVAGRVDRQAHPLEPRADARADLGRVLADATGEHHGVGAAHR